MEMMFLAALLLENMLAVNLEVLTPHSGMLVLVHYAKISKKLNNEKYYGLVIKTKFSHRVKEPCSKLSSIWLNLLLLRACSV